MAIPAIPSYPLPTTLPDPAVSWGIDPARAAILVHDMQEYFLRAYSLTEEPMSAVLPNIRALIDAADRQGIPVFFSAQPPAQHPLRRGLLSEFWGEGMGTDEDAAIVEPLAPREGHTVLTKWRYSAFERTDLRETLAYAGRDQLIITGVYGHMGCKVTAVDAFMSDVQAFLVADAIADFTREDHEETLDWVGRRCGRVLTTAAILDMFEER